MNRSKSYKRSFCSEKMWAELVEQMESLSSARPQKTTQHTTTQGYSASFWVPSKSNLAKAFVRNKSLSEGYGMWQVRNTQSVTIW